MYGLSVDGVAAEWAARRAQTNAAGEFAVVKPYAGLSNAGELNRLTDQYWQAATDDDWGCKLDAYLREQVSCSPNKGTHTTHP